MIQHHRGVEQTLQHVTRLVVAPHAGDEVAGCGGMLTKYRDDSMVVVLGELEEFRERHFRTAQAMLGAPTAVFLGMPARQLADQVDQIVSRLSDLMDRVRPLELYLPYPALHQDHLVAYEAGMRSTRAPAARETQSRVSVLVYEVGAVDMADHRADIRWGVRESLREEDIDSKVDAAIAYRSPGARGLKSGARSIGLASGLSWAEQFALVRAPRGPFAGHRAAQPAERSLVGDRR